MVNECKNDLAHVSWDNLSHPPPPPPKKKTSVIISFDAFCDCILTLNLVKMLQSINLTKS